MICVGCTTLFFQPNRDIYPFIYAQKLAVEDMHFTSHDGTHLRGWYLSSTENRRRFPEITHSTLPTRGLVLQFHGNAENMTSHYQNVAWMLFQGYDILTFDYRGYGQSEGTPDRVGIYEDTVAALHWGEAEATARHLPLIVYGQSLGGSLLMRALEDEKAPAVVKAAIIESAFYSYQQIAREKLKMTWVTWPFQWLAWILISDQFSPGSEKLLQRVSPLPVLLLYSDQDTIVPVHHGQQFLAQLKQPKELWVHSNPGHINSMWVEHGKYRKLLLEYLDKLSK